MTEVHLWLGKPQMHQHQGEVDQVAFQGQEEEVGVEVEEEEVEELVKKMVETFLDYRALGVSLVKGSLNLSQPQQGGEEAVLQLGHLSKFLLRQRRVRQTFFQRTYHHINSKALKSSQIRPS